ncbi:MAG: ergothioneine biosynthesis protein EgtB [Planctomycetota bacterium]
MHSQATGREAGQERCRSIDRGALAGAFRSVRGTTTELTAPLSAEDMVVQPCTHASPAKWHLGHTAWFFDQFVLRDGGGASVASDRRFDVIFNSYYNSIGRQHTRSHRGLLTRPALSEVRGYRERVDAGVLELIEHADDARLAALAPTIEIGLHHEQQHQELLLADIKLTLWHNPLLPAYREDLPSAQPRSADNPNDREAWVGFAGGVVEIGHAGEGFAYDNETPRHRRFLEPYELAAAPVTNADVLAFIDDDGYARPELWLDEGWRCAQREGWAAPLYWEREGEAWMHFTLAGLRMLEPSDIASHLSFFEADAIARWSGARLPTEVEWEHALGGLPACGNLLSSGRLLPGGVGEPWASGLRNPFGDAWCWTRSAHEPYPGYAPPDGALGEYNGKFMCGQFVLRGGSCCTPASHIRGTYRNFFHPHHRWQCSGLRLARSV